jgi:hypothetical protein
VVTAAQFGLTHISEAQTKAMPEKESFTQAELFGGFVVPPAPLNP